MPESISGCLHRKNWMAKAGGTVDQLDKEVLQSLGTEYITDENGRIDIGDLTHETVYYIFESETQPGYHLEQQLYKLTVDANGLIDGKASYELKISNTANNVEITKMDITGGREASGCDADRPERRRSGR